MPQSVIPTTDPASSATVGEASFTPSCHGLLELFLAVSDGRSDQGRDHPVAVVLALVAAATVAGLKGYSAMSGWVADVPCHILDGLYTRAEARPAGRPSRSTLWRVCTDTDTDVLDAVIAEWTTTQQTATSTDTPIQVRLDGKTVRGAVDIDGEQLHLLSALAGPPHQGSAAVVIAQAPTDGAKTREPATARALLESLDLRDVTVTADALHTVKATAELIHQQGGHFVLPVKENRHALFDALDALPWTDTPIGHESTDTGHGRTTRRTIRVLPTPPGLPFPHVKQVWLIERYVTHSNGKQSAAAQLGVTSHPADQAGPAELAAFNRGHWAIETLHFIRDTCYREDHSHVRTRSGPRVLASLRNLAINALRLAGRTDITEATRWANRDMTRPFTILGLTR
ncbi:ISAs1 family transposase [Actinoplanes derwentensis]|uniref:Transposase DDE domain-containing protein n=1 Tax=Actinoplanes derwentensis TaxID=113562 RepID=A0A1H2DE60_9ACTN|nr:ISAs1 family transposase [Actinoplanes derwentensis]SDS44051.1 Transposase DDE domain-containing protein [Actinoplanes derwentensis]SDT52773.1 Transposase DDE domain-containing protein [Actinoplanes derwentensis]SDT72118.1 Transposase DDE domain-containing protein [Actinoplanes derwentensis]SDT80864.1 Transposase DDE domain-containing protein [Actinoplanes derwentensis]GID90582.1 ISAs1 family transposase [Actinoplanes derwentensis]